MAPRVVTLLNLHRWTRSPSYSRQGGPSSMANQDVPSLRALKRIRSISRVSGGRVRLHEQAAISIGDRLVLAFGALALAVLAQAALDASSCSSAAVRAVWSLFARAKTLFVLR